jgi:hypothetical protein
MATKNLQINVKIDQELDILEQHEDKALSALADSLDIENATLVTHEEFWK